MSNKSPKQFKQFKNLLALLQCTHIPIFISWYSLSVAPENTHIQWTDTMVYHDPILYVLPVLAVIFGLKLYLVVCDMCFELEALTKCRRDLAIGYFGMAVCGIVPQVLRIVWMDRVRDVIAFSAICALANFLLAALFIFRHHQKYRVIDFIPQQGAITVRTLVIQFQLACIWFLIENLKYSKEMVTSIGKFCVLYDICYVACSAEFAVVMVGWITLEKENDANNRGDTVCISGTWNDRYNRYQYEVLRKPRLPSPWELRPIAMVTVPTVPRSLGYTAISDSDLFRIQTYPCHTAVHQESQHLVRVIVPTAPMEEEEEETTDGENLQYPISSSTSGTECNICMLRYSTTTVIPRMLVGCGHTVCQACIQKLPRQEFVLCPFCRKPTSLPDNLPSRLPKNYAVLDIIHNLEK
ncbi:hypothetical protein GCK72_011359 [Caenorhabditis remanei]|uniref:RING-type domain-containing protein n=1 Tax=Caenorhabditis remanei TaxID=31234 RepID=A0A6A5H8H3_CAERE|nr:hypothetical protein GCK72_011359 [Caenorhabditis remanei]KAF1763094.1 hypothetical protein GCK72_011359 [Caenorhabditis remanei]